LHARRELARRGQRASRPAVPFRPGKGECGHRIGTAEELDLWDKRATVEDNIRIIRLLRDHGIYLAMGFIQFHPYSTVETLRSNALFLKNHNGHNLRRLTERLEIYPGTVIVGQLEKDGLLEEGYKKTLHHFAYKFKDERVQLLANHFAALYNNEDFHEKGVITEQSSVYRLKLQRGARDILLENPQGLRPHSGGKRRPTRLPYQGH